MFAALCDQDEESVRAAVRGDIDAAYGGLGRPIEVAFGPSTSPKGRHAPTTSCKSWRCAKRLVRLNLSNKVELCGHCQKVAQCLVSASGSDDDGLSTARYQR